MRDWRGRRYWLVGASEGLGRALALEMSRAGATLVISARSGERLAGLAALLPGPAEVVPCDVGDAASVAAAAAAASAAGAIDGVVFLAGVYWPMSARSWDAARVEAMCDLNFTGAARVLGAVVPAMEARGAGHVVLTGSLAAYRGLPGAIGYAASKAALMALAESMRCDLAGSGITVQIANPGYIRTRLTDLNDFKMPFLMSPEDAAARMLRFMATDRFSRAFPAAFGLMFRAGALLPAWLYFRLFGSR